MTHTDIYHTKCLETNDKWDCGTCNFNYGCQGFLPETQKCNHDKIYHHFALRRETVLQENDLGWKCDTMTWHQNKFRPAHKKLCCLRNVKGVQSIAKAVKQLVKQIYSHGHADKIKCKYVHLMGGHKSRENFETNKLKASWELKPRNCGTQNL